MPYPHERPQALEYGRSPGNGITPAPLSAEPLATEGEATPGPDDENPYAMREQQAERRAQARAPTAGEDPYVFDDVAAAVSDVSLPGLDDDGRPQLPRF